MSAAPRPKITKTDIVSDEVNKKSSPEQSYTIPDGVTLTIAEWGGGGEYTKNNARIELVHDDDGTEYLLDVGYPIAGHFSAHCRDVSITGNDAAPQKVILRRVNDTSSKLHMTARWRGYEEPA